MTVYKIIAASGCLPCHSPFLNTLRASAANGTRLMAVGSALITSIDLASHRAGCKLYPWEQSLVTEGWKLRHKCPSFLALWEGQFRHIVPSLPERILVD
jgi:hypothetical protein